MRHWLVFSAIVLIVTALAVPVVGQGLSCTLSRSTSCSGGRCDARVYNHSFAPVDVRLLSGTQANCVPSVTFQVPGSGWMSLTAAKTAAAVNPLCRWSCNGLIVTFEAGDGLPVELLEFTVNGE